MRNLLCKGILAQTVQLRSLPNEGLLLLYAKEVLGRENYEWMLHAALGLLGPYRQWIQSLWSEWHCLWIAKGHSLYEVFFSLFGDVLLFYWADLDGGKAQGFVASIGETLQIA